MKKANGDYISVTVSVPEELPDVINLLIEGYKIVSVGNSSRFIAYILKK